MQVESSLPALMVSDVPSDALRFLPNDKRVDSFCGNKIRNGRAAKWTRPFDVFANQIIDFSFQRMVYLLINFLPFCITTPLYDLSTRCPAKLYIGAFSLRVLLSAFKLSIPVVVSMLIIVIW